MHHWPVNHYCKNTNTIFLIWWHLVAFIFMFLSFYEVIEQGVQSVAFQHTADRPDYIRQFKLCNLTLLRVHALYLCLVHGYLLPRVETDNMASTFLILIGSRAGTQTWDL